MAALKREHFRTSNYPSLTFGNVWIVEYFDYSGQIWVEIETLASVVSSKEAENIIAVIIAADNVTLSPENLHVLCNKEEYAQADKMYAAKFRDDATVSADDAFLLSDYESEDDRNYYFKRELGVDFDPNLILAYICNYKGEGADFMLLSDAKDFPIYVSKCQSFFSV